MNTRPGHPAGSHTHLERTPYVSTRIVGDAPPAEGAASCLWSLNVELTERCNNACVHCYINRPADDVQAAERELPTAAWKQVLTEAASLGCLSVHFTGGEPLLRKDFANLYIFARRLGLKVLLSTNATLITAELADMFARVPPLEGIQVSLYGMTAGSCDAVTGRPGSFDAAWEGVRLLRERHIPFAVGWAVLPQNRPETDRLREWADATPEMAEPPSFAVALSLRARRDSPGKNDLIRALRLPPEEFVRVQNQVAENRRNHLLRFCSQFAGPQGDRLFRCHAGRHQLTVDAYGVLQLCLLLRHPETVYDLKQGSLQEACAEFGPDVRRRRARNPEYLRRCARCFLATLCEQCPAQSWMEHGTLDAPVQYFCDVTHAEATELGLLREGEKSWEVEDWKQRINRCLAKTQGPGRPLPANTKGECHAT